MFNKKKKAPAKKKPAVKKPETQTATDKPAVKSGMQKVVVAVKEIFYGKGPQATRYRRGALVSVPAGKLPEWAETIDTAQARFDKQGVDETPEPKTMSEINKQRGPEKAFGQEI